MGKTNIENKVQMLNLRTLEGWTLINPFFIVEIYKFQSGDSASFRLSSGSCHIVSGKHFKKLMDQINKL